VVACKEEAEFGNMRVIHQLSGLFANFATIKKLSIWLPNFANDLESNGTIRNQTGEFPDFQTTGELCSNLKIMQ
jgi:hypothetical protein